MSPSTGTTYNTKAIAPPTNTAITGGYSRSESRDGNARRPSQASATDLPNNPVTNSAKPRNGIRIDPITVTSSSRNTIGLQTNVNNAVSVVRPGLASIVRTH